MPRSFLIRKKLTNKVENRARTISDVIRTHNNDVIRMNNDVINTTHDDVTTDDNQQRYNGAKVESLVPQLFNTGRVTAETRKEIWSPLTPTDTQRRVGTDHDASLVPPVGRFTPVLTLPHHRIGVSIDGIREAAPEQCQHRPSTGSSTTNASLSTRAIPASYQHRTSPPVQHERRDYLIDHQHKSITPSFVYSEYFHPGHPLTPSPTNIPLISYMYSTDPSNFHSYDSADVKQFTREARPLFASGKTSPFFSSCDTSPGSGSSQRPPSFMDSPDSSSQRPQSSMIPSPVDSLVTLISASDFSPNGRSRGSSGGDSTSDCGRSTSSGRQPQRRSNSFQDGITVGYTYDAFFISDGRTRRRQQQTVPSTGSSAGTTAAAPELPIAGGPLEPIRLQRYKCSECGKHYATSSNLSRHKQTHRSLESQQAKQCPHCRKVYVSMPALSMHILTHDLKYQCTVCSKAFSRPWLLQGHLRSHSGEKPYGCTHCGRAFADRSNLRAHMQTHSAYKMYTCLRCNKSFALKAYLNKHLESACFKDDESCSSMTSIWSV